MRTASDDTRPGTGLIALFVALLALLGLMTWAGQRQVQVSGLTRLLGTADGGAWALLNGELLRLDADGAETAILTRARLADAGLPGRLVALADDGAGGVWVGSADSGELRRLDPAGQPRGRIAPAQTGAGTLFGDFQAARDAASGRLILADTQNHRVLTFDADGTLLAATTEGSAPGLRYPNGLASLPGGGVLLADTNGHRLLRLSADLATLGEPVPQPADAGSRRWPVWVAAGDARLYASWHDAQLGQGDVAVHEAASGVLLHRLRLPPAAEPLALWVRGPADVRLSLSGPDGYSLRRYDDAGRDLGAWGAPELRARLAAASAEHRQWRLLATAGRWGAIGAGALLLLLAALRHQKALARRPGSEVLAFELRGPDLRTQLRAYGPLILVMAAALAGVEFGEDRLTRLQRLWLLGGLFLVMPALLLLELRRLSAGALATALRVDETHTALRHWLPSLARLLEAGESVRRATRVGDERARPALLLVTDRRLLVLAATPWLGSRPRWTLDLARLPAARLAPASGRQRLLAPQAQWLELAPGHRLLVGHQEQADELLGWLVQARQEATACPPAAITPPPPPTPRLQRILLSLLLPGLAQIRQGRADTGFGFILAALVLLGIGTVSGIVLLERVADQPALQWLLPVSLYVLVMALALADALRDRQT